jgi:pyruvate dehydrogenase E2 component (dihydrolipoamide acetyltransferase)
MATIFIPSIGVAMEEALLVKWLKQPGEPVSVDEPVAEIETDKTGMDLNSPVSGVLGPHLVAEGAIIPVGTAIVEVIEEGAQALAASSAPAESPPAAPAVAPEPDVAMVGEGLPAVAEGGRVPHALSPRARRAAREAALAGAAPGTTPDRASPAETGPAETGPVEVGLVEVGPVEVGPVEAGATGSGADPVGVEASSQAGRFRALIAAKVSESWREIPHFSVTREIDAEAMLATLALLRTTSSDPVPTLTDLMLRALALGLREFGHRGPSAEGLAVATEFGVIIPVVRQVLVMDAGALARARKAAIERARSGRLSPEDLADPPPSTLSNLGPFGVDQFTGVIALGQQSLLTVGRAAPRVVADDARTIRVRTSFLATLNADHRVIDGAGAAQLLASFAAAAQTMTSSF